MRWSILLLLCGAARGEELEIATQNKVGQTLDLREITYALDGDEVLHVAGDDPQLKQDILGKLQRQPSPGLHKLTARLAYQGKRMGVFSYLAGYTFKIDVSADVKVEAGHKTMATLVAWLKPGSSMDYEKRPTAGIYVSYDPPLVELPPRQPNLSTEHPPLDAAVAPPVTPDEPPAPEAKSEKPPKDEQLAMAEKPAKPEKPAKAARPPKPEKPARAAKPPKPEKPAKVAKTKREPPPEETPPPEEAETPAQVVEKPPKPEKPARAAKPPKPEKPAKVAKTKREPPPEETPEETPRPEKPARAEKPPKPEKPMKVATVKTKREPPPEETPEETPRPEKPARAEKPPKPEKPARAEKPPKPEKPMKVATVKTKREPPAQETATPEETPSVAPPKSQRAAHQRVRTELINPSGITSTIVNFGFDAEEPHRNFLSVLDEIARSLVAHPEIHLLRIEGHTDDVGAETYNQGLSERRARWVANYLIGKSVAPGRVHSVGFGETRPREHGSERAARAQNRRIEFVIEQ